MPDVEETIIPSPKKEKKKKKKRRNISNTVSC